MKLLERQDIKYLSFDFHEECKNNNYSRLSVLVNLAKEIIESNSYFLQDKNNKVVLQQKGNVRTNCIDCLDRTNVVQSQFGRFILKEQLSNLGIISKDEDFDNELNVILNNIWTNNADTLSKRYTGVGALKTDFTRTGKRSAAGAVADGVKSVTRLYHSTFNDDYKQDTIDFFLDKLTFKRLNFFTKKDENIIYWNVFKKSTWDSKNETMKLQLNLSNGEILLFSRETFICKSYSVSDLRHISRFVKNFIQIETLIIFQLFMFANIYLKTRLNFVVNLGYFQRFFLQNI